VDGIYDSDPFKNPNAVRYSTLTYNEALSKQLAVMDQTAFSMCRDNDLPIIVFNFADENSLDAILRGDTEAGTVVSSL
jgi:uridylate kinase